MYVINYLFFAGACVLLTATFFSPVYVMLEKLKHSNMECSVTHKEFYVCKILRFEISGITTSETLCSTPW